MGIKKANMHSEKVFDISSLTLDIRKYVRYNCGTKNKCSQLTFDIT